MYNSSIDYTDSSVSRGSSIDYPAAGISRSNNIDYPAASISRGSSIDYPAASISRSSYINYPAASISRGSWEETGSVSEHMGWVRNVVLMSVYLGLGNPRGLGFQVGGQMCRRGKYRGQLTSNPRKRWTDPVTARRVPSKWKGEQGGLCT